MRLVLLLVATANALRVPTDAFNRRFLLGGVAAGLGSSLVPALPARAYVESSPLSSNPLCDPCVSLVQSGTGQQIALVGTAHISDDSAVLVRRVIQQLQPDTVMIELDASRAGRLMQRRDQAAGDTQATPPSASSEDRKPTFGMGQLAGRLLRGDFEEAGAQAVGLSLSSLYKQLDSMGFQSGGEFVAAVEEADRVGAKILLGDRDARVTIRRLRDAFAEVLANPPSDVGAPPPSLMSATSGSNEFTKENVMSTMAVLKQRENVRELASYMRREVPPLYAALIEERDAYMANSILQSDGKRVVAVVGLAHVDGIEASVLRQGSLQKRPQACPKV